MNAIRQVLERLEEFCCDNGDDEVLSTDPNRSLSIPTPSGHVGRPAFRITEELDHHHHPSPGKQCTG